jgi:hypothetical protein
MSLTNIKNEFRIPNKVAIRVRFDEQQFMPGCLQA